MMNRNLFDAIHGIDPRLIADAAPNEKKKKICVKPWMKCGIAACIVLIAMLHIGVSPNRLPTVAVQPSLTQGNDSASENAINKTQIINSNEINTINITQTQHLFALMVDDYIPMTYPELLKYFDISLPLTELFPDLSLSNDAFGIYQSDKRGVYYDSNNITFASKDETKNISIGLSKVTKNICNLFDLTENELQFTTVNDRELAIFHYMDEKGSSCYYTEFLQNDIAFSVGCKNISAEEFVKYLQALVGKPQFFDTGHTHSVSGKVTFVDPQANRIGIEFNNCAYGIELPEESFADNYSLGDLVEVTFFGEPVTVCTIWKQQIVHIEALK